MRLVPKHYCLSKDQWLLLLAPCVLTLILWLLISSYTHDVIPTDLNATHWKNFTHHLQESLNTTNEDHVLLYLLVIHASQVVCCVPLMHITKILYGYFFGTVVGGILGSAWEMGLVVLFVLVCVQNAPTKPAPSNLQMLFDYVDSLRRENKLYIFLLFLQMASMPLVTGTSLVLFQIVTPTEFVVSHLVVTVLMTFKDTFLGEYIANSRGEPVDIIVTSVLFLLSTLLPSMLTLIIMGAMSNSALQLLQSANTEAVTECTDALIKDEKTSLEASTAEYSDRVQDTKDGSNNSNSPACI